jgi:hypothetical protein
MRNPNLIFILIFFCVLTLSVKASGIKGDSIEINNPYFFVLRNTNLQLETDTNHVGKRVLVALNHVEIRKSGKAIKLERGQIAVFHPKESYSVLTGNFFEIGFKVNHPPLKVPEQWIEPTKNIVVYDDPELRVFEERLASGDTREVHSHAQRVVVRLNLVQLTDPRFHDKPKAGSGIQVPNTVKYAEPIVHAVKNTSEIPLFNIVIEYKVPH